MWKLKGCVRCRGDVFLAEDEHGRYEQCLQCGYRNQLETTSQLKTGLTGGKAEPAARVN
jgi:ribosomal protein S27AE